MSLPTPLSASGGSSNRIPDDSSDTASYSPSSSSSSSSSSSAAAAASRPGPKPANATVNMSSPSSTRVPKKLGIGALAGTGTGPEIPSDSVRRSKGVTTYNLKHLTYQARAPLTGPPSKPSTEEQLASASRPAFYNFDVLVEKARGMNAATQQVAKQFAREMQGGASHSSIPHVAGAHGPDRPPKRLLPGDDRAHTQPPAKRQKPEADVRVAAVEDSFLQSDDASTQNSESHGQDSPTASTRSPDMPEAWKRILPVLLSSEVAEPYIIPPIDVLTGFVALPAKRDIELSPGRRNIWLYRGTIDIISLLIQATGEHPPSPCTYCQGGKGQYVGCIVASSQASPGNVYGCANCVYHGKQTFCSLKDYNKARHYAHGNSSSCASPLPPLLDAPVETPSQPRTLEKHQQTTSGESNRREHPRVAGEASSLTDATRTNYLPRDISPASAFQDAVAQRDSEILPNSIPKTGGTSLVCEGSAVTGLTMEEWEKAPGRIRSRTTESPENIAFSKSYLAAGRELQVCKEAAFQVELLRSGHTHNFTPQDSVIRLCSIAAGKLTVKIEGEDPFVIGPHGMFKVRPGSACLVECEAYEDVAVLHITTIKTDD